MPIHYSLKKILSLPQPMKPIKLFFLLFLSPTLFWGQSYFQQEVNYTINVKLDDAYHVLNAFETIVYKNNSPDALPFIYMHLWPNAYKDNTTCLAHQMLDNGDTKLYFSSDAERGYIDSLHFLVDNKEVSWHLLPDSIDICQLVLSQPLLPGQSISITTPFRVKIPSATISRLGHIEQSYMITQWYPKPAVYDRNGWNPIPYLNQGEFYSEFGTYDVSITLPSNYVLGATGDMVNGEKELEWLDKKEEETKAIDKFDADDMDFPLSDCITKTLHFKQSNVHDFAWFADKRYHVLKGEVTTPHTAHKVTTWAMFTNAEGDLWKNSIPYLNDAIHYYSLWNGDYPYNQCTAVDGTISAGGGMEYPNITVIGSSGSAFMLDVVITHEVGHNWFYGMLGSNERMHPWMDEGINSYNENRYVQTKYPNMSLAESYGAKKVEKLFHLTRFKHKASYDLGYQLTAQKNEDQPIEFPAFRYSEFNYGADVYYKTSEVFDCLRAYLGDSLMDKAMQSYFDQWHYKHPMPSDFRKVMEETTGKKLSWFFDGLINTTRKLDYKIDRASRNADGTWNIQLTNKGRIASPVFISAINQKKAVATKTYEGFEGTQSLVFPATDAKAFKIDANESLPEINRKNNTIRTRGIFRKVEPIRLQFLGSLSNPDKTQLYFTPVAGWNEYNKGMLGLAFYNNLLPQKKLEFQLMTMYSFTQKDVSGYARIMWHLKSHNQLVTNGDTYTPHLSVGITALRYDYSNDPFPMYYNKFAPEVLLEVVPKSPSNRFTSSFRYQAIHIMRDDYQYQYILAANPTDSYYKAVSHQSTFVYHDITYRIKRSDAINPFDMSTNFQSNKDFNKIAFTFNYSHNFKNKNKSFDLRLFAGSFIGENKSTTEDYRFRLSGQRGYQDYLYDHIYLGRSETRGVLANQFTETDGAFKFYSPIGQTSKWITVINLKSSLGNAKIPLNLYADIGTTEYDGIFKDKLLYDAGVCLSFPKNVFEIYFPLFICQDFTNYKTANDLKYQETIRFTLNINLLNPFDLINKFKL